MSNKIFLRVEQEFDVKDVVDFIVDEREISEDTIFELIKELELKLADEEFCKRLADYFTNEYNKCMDLSSLEEPMKLGRR